VNLAACVAFSLHILPGDWNAVHPCIRLEHDGWIAGAYLNSEGRVSFSAGREWTSGPWWAEAGLATGYEGAPLVPVIRGGYDFGPARAFVAPAMTVKQDVGLVLGVEFLIGD
jgi:hypothetical protein